MRRWLFLLLALVACDGDDGVDPNHLEANLSLEIRDQLSVVIDIEGDVLQVQLTPSASYGLLPAGQTLQTTGRLERLPEANGLLYTAKLEGPAQPDGPCGNDPVTLALSLHRQGENATVMGSLTAYCGARALGIPARVLRVAGTM